MKAPEKNGDGLTLVQIKYWNMKKIAIIVDNPLRDLPACVLMAGALAEKGFQAFLISFDNAPQSAFWHEPDYILVNYARVTNEKFLLRLYQSGVAVGILDTEGGVFMRLEKEGGVPNFVKTYSKNPAVNAGIQDYFVWGEEICDFLRSSHYFPSECLRLTGTPRSDILHPSLRVDNPNHDKVILINTSFTLANPKFRSAEAEAEDLVKKFGYSHELVYPTLEAQKILLQKFIQITRDLTRSFPNERFVLRPHPFENHELYRKGLEGISQVEVRGDSTIDEWLSKSKALLHFECSTALEAALMNVPAFSLKESANLRPIEVIAKITHYCENFNDLCAKLHSVLGGTYVKPEALRIEHQKMIQNVYYRFDGQSHLRIANLVQKSILQNQKSKTRAPLLYWKFFYITKNILKRILGRPLIRKEKSFSRDQVQQLLANFKSVKSPTWNDLQCSQVSNSVFISKPQK